MNDGDASDTSPGAASGASRPSDNTKPQVRSRRSAWRAQASVQIQDLRTQLDWMAQDLDYPEGRALARAVNSQLDEAQRTIDSHGSILAILTGSEVQAAQEYIDAAYVNLLRLAPEPHLRSLLPNLLVEAGRHLSSADPRLQVLTRRAMIRTCGWPSAW